MSDFRVDDGQCPVSFKRPGYTADVFIDRESGAYDDTETKMGLAAILNDLDEGRDGRRAWAWVIDASAVFMTVLSVSGTCCCCSCRSDGTPACWPGSPAQRCA
jgi:hypothetical protein